MNPVSCTPMDSTRRCLVLLPLFLVACRASPQPRDPNEFQIGTARSTDVSAIHFLEGGTGSTTLVFVHGWLGDLSVWEPTMRRFAPHYRVVALDLAGHGASSRDRTQWTVENFGADVAAVVRVLQLQHVVLIGHSMSGPICVAAVDQLGPCVEALIPVDTMLDVEWDMPPEAWAGFFDGLRKEFPSAVESFFRGFLVAKTSPKDVIDGIVEKARRADPKIAVPMLERAREFDLKRSLASLSIPIHAINSDMNPTRLEVNRKYAPRFDCDVIAGVGHWPHLEAPQEFGDALERVLTALGR